MTFSELRTACDNYRALLRESTGRELIVAVSVDQPAEPQDELYFVKLIAWCYVLLFEASQPATRHILSLLRAGDPEEHRTISAVVEHVNCLRTVRVHNLSPDRRGDDRKRRQARIWLIQNGGEPPDWRRCSDTLCTEVGSAIEAVMIKWRRLTKNSHELNIVIQDLLLSVDREWPAHAFDRMIEEAVTNIGLLGFDCLKYRQYKLEKWRELVSFFENRADAETAMKAAIHRELEQQFGPIPSGNAQVSVHNSRLPLF